MVSPGSLCAAIKDNQRTLLESKLSNLENQLSKLLEEYGKVPLKSTHSKCNDDEDVQCGNHFKQHDPMGKKVKKMLSPTESFGKRKRLTKDEREQQKEEKLREKMRKKEANDLLKRVHPSTCMEYTTVNVDDNLMRLKFGNEVLKSILEYGSSQLVRKQNIPFSITWTIKTMVNGLEIDKDELPILLIWTAEQFLTAIQNETLFNDIKTLQEDMPNNKFTLAIFDLETYFNEQTKQVKKQIKNQLLNESEKGKKISKRFKSFNYSRCEVEDVLVDLQLLYDCSTRVVNTVKDVASTVQQFTKAIAETPFKLEKQKQQVEGLGWLTTLDLRDCVRVDKAGNGLSQLWLQQLMQFNNSGLDIAQAIVQKYPTPLALYKAYCNCDSSKEGEELLKDILIRRGIGEAAAKRRIGPELSRKLYYFFTSLDGDLPLSQD